MKSLKLRMKDPFWTENFEAAVKRIMASKFCMGQNDRGWVATFDFLLQEDKIEKIMEGKYDNRDGMKPKPSNQDWTSQPDYRDPDMPRPHLSTL
jgi:hypothetical protein